MPKVNPKVYDGGLTVGCGPVAVGLDQSYTGFGLTAISVTGGEYYTWVYEGQGSGTDRLIDIRRFLVSTLEDVQDWTEGITRVAMEGYAYGSKTANMAGELGSLVKVSLRDRFELDPIIVAPTSLKKFVTGKGTGVQKNQILLSVYKKWLVEYHDDNAADSYALARIAAGLVSTAYEREVYSRLQVGAKE